MANACGHRPRRDLSDAEGTACEAASQRVPDDAPAHYERHRSEQTGLYSLMQPHAASFIAYAEVSTGAEMTALHEERVRLVP